MNDYLRLFREKRLVLIMSLPRNDPALCRVAFAAGADAVKVHINVEHRASGTFFGRLAEERATLEEMLAERAGPMGVVLGGTLESAALDAGEIRALPFAFHSVYAHCLPVRAMRSGAALMAACDDSYSPDEIAAMPQCGADVVEASVVPGAEYGRPLSMRDLLRYRSIARAVDAPVVVPTQRAIRPEETAALRDCGVRGLMIGAIVAGKSADSIARAVAAYREAIDRMCAR